MNREERNALVVENLPLVGYLVSELCARATHLSRDDLASVGALGLISAAESFKPELGIPFGAFARRRITGAFSDELRSNDWASRGTRRRIRETLEIEERLTATFGRTPTVDEVAHALGVGRDEAAEALADSRRNVTVLDESATDRLVAETVLPEEALLEDERTGFVRSAVDVLPERMRHIVRAIYFEDRTVKEVAEELGITHSAVSQQRAEAIRLLRDGLNTHYADDESTHEPQARVSAASRAAYLARLGSQAFSPLAGLAPAASARIAV